MVIFHSIVSLPEGISLNEVPELYPQPWILGGPHFMTSLLGLGMATMEPT
jgi:hypothetical protein